MKRTGNDLAQMLDDRGLTQARFATAIKCSQSRVSRYISGEALPSFSRFCSMREALGITADALADALNAGLRRRRRNGAKA